MMTNTSNQHIITPTLASFRLSEANGNQFAIWSSRNTRLFLGPSIHPRGIWCCSLNDVSVASFVIMLTRYISMITARLPWFVTLDIYILEEKELT